MKDKLVLAVFIDAFGWEILKAHPFLCKEAPFRKKIDTIFGYSCTAIPTILTGSPPSEHGHFSFFLHNGQSPFESLAPLGLIPEFIAGRGRVRNKISGLVKRLYGFTGYFQLYNVPFEYLKYFDYCEKQDLYQPGGLAPCQTLFDELHSRNVNFFVSDWRKSEKYNLAQAKEVIDKGEVDLAYIYTAELDGLLHFRGKGHPDIAKKVEHYEKHLIEILSVARKRYKEVSFAIFSDHGMNDIFEDVELMKPIADLKLEFGEDYIACYDSTMARFWFKKEEAKKAIQEVLRAESRGRILTKEELSTWGSWFPDGRYGELIFLMDPGRLIVPSFMGKKTMKGMHGYDPSCADAAAMMVSNEEIGNDVCALTDIKGLLLSKLAKDKRKEKAA